MSDDPVFSTEASGMTLSVFPDRVEVEMKRRNQTIPIAEVKEVYVSRRPKKLVIVTTAGKTHQFLLGHDVEMARGIIHAQLTAAASPTPHE
jgi:hypothetical protein